MRTRTLAALAAPMITLLFVAGCAGGSGEESTTAARPASEPADGPANGLTARREGVAVDSMSAFDATGASGGGATATRTSGKAPNPPEFQARAVISKGTVTLQGKDVAQARFDLMKVVDEHGGEVSDEQTSTDDDGRVSRSRLVLRIPSEDFDATMGELARIPGTDLKSAKRTSEDVTTQVIDTAVRIRAQKASIERIEALLQRAQSIRSIVWIESQLTQRQADLDSLEQQQAYLTDQTSLSTITVYLEQTPEPPAQQKKKDHDDAGFGAGLDSGWHALSAAGTAMATFVGAVLPFAVLLALVGIPAWIVLRRRIRTGRDPLPAP